MNENEYEKIKAFVKKAARKFKILTQEDVENITQELALDSHRLGYIRNASQAIIDYLRKDSGRKGARSYVPGRLSALDASGGENSIQNRHDFGRDVGGGKIDYRLLRGTEPIDRAIVVLTYEWGLNEAEIGDLFGFDASRTCQRLKRVQNRLRTRIEQEAWKQREETSGMEAMGREKRQGVERGAHQIVAPISPKRMVLNFKTQLTKWSA